MGLCFSRRKGSRPSPPKSTEDLHIVPPEIPIQAVAQLEEETVKEVLSETPMPKAQPRPFKEEICIHKEMGSDVSTDERAEGCSVSEGFSVSTTATEITAEEKQAPASPAKLQRKRSTPSRERMVGSVAFVGCRSGRSSPSPVKRREGSGGRICSAARSRGNTPFRDPGERSGRRSMSPAGKQKLPGHCRGVLAAKTIGLSSPAKIGGGEAAECSRFSGGERRTMAREMEECGGCGVAEEKESLENPHVSLECFIFL